MQALAMSVIGQANNGLVINLIRLKHFKPLFIITVYKALQLYMYLRDIRSIIMQKRLYRKTAMIGLFSSLALGLLSPIAVASVKDGVDAWSRGEYEVAVKEWRPEALNGDPDAQFNMGQAYKLGRGVPSNLDTALDWYKKASEQGHLQASDSYGHLLHYQGRVRDSIPFLKQSSERGEPRSQYLYATELFNGVNAEKDWVRAYALMTRASSSGLGPASRSLAQMDRFIPLSQRQEGITLAGNLEQNERSIKAQQLAGFNLDTSPAPDVAKPVTLPPSEIAAITRNQAPPEPVSVQPGAPFLDSTPPSTTVPASSLPASTSVASAPPRNIDSNSGNFRIQLGAFGKQSSAKTAWNDLEGRVSELRSIQPYLIPSGNVTRLQAGPFATRSQADAVCQKIKATGKGCFSLTK